MPLTPSLLLLADSRLPAGGHAHSGGVEAATVAGQVTDLAGLAGFLHGRLGTAGLASAGLPAPSSPGLDVLAQRHAAAEVALFES
jgi:urease accessory protein